MCRPLHDHVFAIVSVSQSDRVATPFVEGDIAFTGGISQFDGLSDTAGFRHVRRRNVYKCHTRDRLLVRNRTL